MHLRNSWTRSMSAWAIRQVPSGASGGRGLNFLIFFFTRKFHETSVIKSRMQRKRPHRLDGDRLVERDRVQSRHAHQLRHAIDFRRTGTALAGFAIPSAGQIIGLLRLNLVHGVEHHHPLGNFRGKFRQIRRRLRHPARF